MIENYDDFRRYKKVSEKYYRLAKELITKYSERERFEILRRMGLNLDFKTLSSDYKEVCLQYIEEF